MKLRTDVKETGHNRRRRYNFTGIKPGSSAWVATAQERAQMLSAFKYYVRKNGAEDRAYATSEKVDETDPDGTGYRVFFKSRKADMIQNVTPPAEDEI